MRWITLLLLTTSIVSARTWKSTDGRALDAELVSEDGTSVKLKRPDGSEVTVEIVRFSQEDQAYIASLRKPAEPVFDLPAVEKMPVFDFGLVKVESRPRYGKVVHHWGMIEVLSDKPLEKPAFEKAFKPVLGAHRVLRYFGFPQETLPSAKAPAIVSLHDTAEAVAKASGEKDPLEGICLLDGRVFGSRRFYKLDDTSSTATAPEPAGVSTHSLQMQNRWSSLLPGWLEAGLVAYAQLIPWEDGWPQPGRAGPALQAHLKDRASKGAMLINPSLLDKVVTVQALPPLKTATLTGGKTATPQELQIEALHTASLLVLYYLRHLEGDGQGTALKQALEAQKAEAVRRGDYMVRFAAYREVWEAIKADPHTKLIGEGRYSFSNEYEVPEVPDQAIEQEALEKGRRGVQAALLAVLGDKPGSKILAALQKAGLGTGLSSDSGTALAADASNAETAPSSFTPDYKTAAPTKPHKPLAQRTWPVEVIVSTSAVNPALVSSTAYTATWRFGRFQFETGPGLTVPLVKEIARTFVALEELVERLPWEMPPQPANNQYFIAKLYPDRAAYDAIAPPSSGGFYSLKEKVFHVPYASLGMVKGSDGKWSKPGDFNSDTLVHELTHMMMDRVGQLLPIWTAEGSAEYVETIPFKNGVMKASQVGEALKGYVKHMTGISQRTKSTLSFKASAKRMTEIMHMSHEQWNNYAMGTQPKTQPTGPGPIPRPVILIGQPDPRIAVIVRQHELYMHACLLFYYFLHLDSTQRGDPMLTFFDKLNDLAPQWDLYRDAVRKFEPVMKEYQTAWEAFSNLPGVTKLPDGRISYPSTMKPPTAPTPPEPPFRLASLPDNDLGLAHLEVLIKGRSDEVLEKAFRDGFKKIGIELE